MERGGMVSGVSDDHGAVVEDKCNKDQEEKDQRPVPR
jgi:hypothetical protein